MVHERRLQLRVAGPRGRSVDELGVDIDAGHAATGSNAPCEFQRRMTRTRANVENAQAGLQIERTEDRLHRRMVGKNLVVSAMALGVDIDPMLLVVRLGHHESAIQTIRSSFIAVRSLSAGPAVIGTSGNLNSLAHLPMNASACLIGIGFVSTNSARISGSNR